MRVAWLIGTIGLIALIALPHMLVVFGMEMYVVGGGSMEPTIPLGSVVVVHRVDPNSVQVGQIVTFEVPQGTVVTHRVVGRSDVDGAQTFTTKGDANKTADATPVPANALVGEVVLSVPMAGRLIASLSSTAGEVMLICLLGGMLLASWFFDELVLTLRRSATRRTVVRATN
jgi:signal peptidase I